MFKVVALFEEAAFEPEAVAILAQAYEKARKSLHDKGQTDIVQEIIAKRIVAAARLGGAILTSCAKQRFHQLSAPRLFSSGSVMSSSDSVAPDSPEPPHPLCPTCGVAMWLMKIEHRAVEPLTDRLHFECKACDGRVIIPPLD